VPGKTTSTVVVDGELEWITSLRIQHARETLAALERLSREQSAENIVALHELHALHLRERGDEEGAVRAEKRAERTRQLSLSPLRLSPPSDSGA
jgi:hypothetical protein